MGRRKKARPARSRGRQVKLDAIHWSEVGARLDSDGCAVVRGLLDGDACRAYASAYDAAARYRSRVVMERHGFGRGEYQYFAYPLPDRLAHLRRALYPSLAHIANRWHAAMGMEVRFPDDHAAFIARCHAAGQLRPTPLILQYREGDYNCLHQDLYGEHVFPLQVAVLLSRPGEDFNGGEFVLTEQRPRMQSRVEVVQLKQGDAVIFPVNLRPVSGARGVYRVSM
ncbi:MAG: 2OG-Fe(II) oxygenase, partial [Massilia sp.]|nr:2OG-Fe(II) oxygenase [Massilia sp.]